MWVQTPTFIYRNRLYKSLAEKLSKKGEFLLIGTGTGEFIKYLIDMGYKGTAIDISASSVKQTKEFLGKTNRVVVKKADIFKYKPGRKFDFVFCFEVLEHIKDDTLAIKKIAGFLKPGGTFIMSVPAHMSLWAKMDEIGGHIRRYERNELKSKIIRSGFRIKTFWSYGFPVLNLIRMVSKSGSLVRDFNFNKSELARSKKSGIRTEYNPKLAPLVTSDLLLKPAFWLMDLFLETDWGLGYLVVAIKKRK